MKHILTFLIIVATTKLWGQDGNKYARLTKREFKELLGSTNRIVPPNLGDTVVIVRYSGLRLLEMQTAAMLEPWSTGMTKAEVEKRKVNADKFALWFPEKLKKALKKKKKESIIVDETELQIDSRYKSNYWLRTTYVSDRKASDDHGWYMTVTNMFYDPRTDTQFEIFLPVNYNVIDLIK